MEMEEELEEGKEKKRTGKAEHLDQTFWEVKQGGQGEGPSRITMPQATTVRSASPAQTLRLLSWKKWARVFVGAW